MIVHPRCLTCNTMMSQFCCAKGKEVYYCTKCKLTKHYSKEDLENDREQYVTFKE